MKTQPAPGVAIFCLAYFPIRAEAQSAKLLLGRQTKPNKSKENQGKRLGFPWIPLAELGLFNGLRRIQNKKILSRVTLRRKYHKSRFLFLGSRFVGQSGLHPIHRNTLSINSDFQQTNGRKLYAVPRVSRRPRSRVSRDP
jgi:hypothetical protein